MNPLRSYVYTHTDYQLSLTKGNKTLPVLLGLQEQSNNTYESKIFRAFYPNMDWMAICFLNLSGCS